MITLLDVELNKLSQSLGKGLQNITVLVASKWEQELAKEQAVTVVRR